MAIFSRILKQQDDTRKIANIKGEQLKMQITLDAIKEDMERLTAILPSIPHLSHQDYLELIKEIERFYAIVERLTRSKNGLSFEKQQELDRIFNHLREIKKATTESFDKKPLASAKGEPEQ